MKDLLLENLPKYDVIQAKDISNLAYSLELSERATISAISQALINIAVELRHVKYDIIEKDFILSQMQSLNTQSNTLNSNKKEKNETNMMKSEEEVSTMVTEMGRNLGLTKNQINLILEFVVRTSSLTLFHIYIC